MKKDDDAAVLEGKDKLDAILEQVNTKALSEKLIDGKKVLAKVTKGIQKSLKENIHDTSEKTKEIFTSFKKEKDKVRNLEAILHIDKSEMLVSNKKNYIYRSEAGKVTIVDRDVWGEPTTVTEKDGSKVVIRCVKYFEDQPYLYPIFNEKDVMGVIIYADPKEIWYLDKNNVTVVMFKGSKAEIFKTKASNELKADKNALISYVKNYLKLNKDKRFAEILAQKDIKLENITSVSENYIAYKSQDNTYKVLLIEEGLLYEEISLNLMPAVEDSGLAVLFSKEMVTYIKTSNYNFENFKQSGDFIEYWQNIGYKRVCVMRFKV